jgi:hypothetical protein
MVNSRLKGKVGELEACKFLREEIGIDARRTAQYCGNTGDASDIVSDQCDRVHFEVKRVELLNIHKAVNQAENDCPEGKLPVVLHRKNNTKWLVTMRLSKKNIELLKSLA